MKPGRCDCCGRPDVGEHVLLPALGDWLCPRCWHWGLRMFRQLQRV